MPDLGAGTPLPDIKSTTKQTTATPDFYLEHLKDIATRGQTASKTAKYIGTQPLQQQARDLAKKNVGSTQKYVDQAGTAITGALKTDIPGAAQQYMDKAAAPTSQTVQDYMNPFTKNVVESIGALGNQNISQNLAPQTTAGIVGAGQFGSQRGANALAQNIANAGVGVTGLQAGALQSGYTQALQAAQNQANIYGNLAQIAGNQANSQGQLQLSGAQAAQNLGTGSQQFGLNDINALSTMGAQEQTNAQNEQLFPLQQLSTESNLLRGYNMPTTVTSNYEGPGQAGQYSSSPLSQIAGIGGIVGGVANSTFGNWIGDAVKKWVGP